MYFHYCIIAIFVHKHHEQHDNKLNLGNVVHNGMTQLLADLVSVATNLFVM